MTNQHKHDAASSGTGTTTQSQGGAADTLASSREKLSDAARRATEGLEANPLGVVVGGLAVGAIVGALLPRSDREKQLLAPAGKRINETARAAVQAAREAGYAELDQRGLTKHAAKDQAKGLIDGLGKALTHAGTAAAGAARGKTDATDGDTTTA